MSKQSQSTRRDVLVGAAAAAASIGFVRPALAAADQSKVVTLLATLQINKGKRDDAIKFLSALTKAVEKAEPGTLAYVAHTYKEDPNKVVFFEVYADADAKKKHKPGALIPKLGISGKGLFAGGAKVEFVDRICGYIR